MENDPDEVDLEKSRDRARKPLLPKSVFDRAAIALLAIVALLGILYPAIKTIVEDVQRGPLPMLDGFVIPPGTEPPPSVTPLSP